MFNFGNNDQSPNDSRILPNLEIIEEEYVDFRNYPIPIDWYDCEERNFVYGCSFNYK